jgi:hypothetical protein
LKQFLCKRTRLGHELKSVEVFGANEDIELGVAAQLARIEGLEIEVFVGTDLVDVVRSNANFFEEAGD